MNMRTTMAKMGFSLMILVVALLGMVALGCGSGKQAATSSSSQVAATSSSSQVAATSSSPQVSNRTLTIDQATTGAAEDPLVAQKAADIVVYGLVVKIDPGRWNSADGKYWQPNDPSGMSVAAIYRTYYVQPAEILKGTPKWATPVAFMVVGGTGNQTTGPVSVGDTVLVIGTDYPALYGDVYWKDDAYFAQNGDMRFMF
jgi:hypothetical protein